MEELDYYQIPLPQSLEKRIESRDLTWDPEKIVKNLELSNENKRLRRTTSKGWDMVIGNKSVHSYYVKPIDSNPNIYLRIGMAPRTIDVNDSGNFDQFGYYLLANGRTYDHRDQNVRNYTNRVSVDSIIGVHWNRENCTISFSVNGENKGIAFENIPKDEDLFPCIEIGIEMIIDIVK